MNSIAVINLKTDRALKKEAQALADKLGLSLSAVLNNSLRQFVATRQFTAVEDYVPTDELKAIIRKSRESGQKAKRLHSKRDAVAFIDDL